MSKKPTVSLALIEADSALTVFVNAGLLEQLPEADRAKAKALIDKAREVLAIAEDRLNDARVDAQSALDRL